MLLISLLLQSFGVSQEEIEQVLKEFDTNNDGEIDYNGTWGSFLLRKCLPVFQFNMTHSYKS